MSWKKVALSEIMDLQNGFAFNSEDYVESSNVYNCRMSNIRPGGDFDIDYNPRFLPDEFAIKYSQFLLKEGDIIVAMTDLANDPKILGIPTIVNTNKKILLNQRVGKLIVKDEKRVFIPFLKYALNRKEVQKYFAKFSSGGLQINLGKNDLLSYTLSLPLFPIQKRIAEILDAADALKRKDQQLLQKYDELAQAIFIDMFGDPVKNEKGWEVKTIEQLVKKTRHSIKRGPFGGALKKEIFVSDGYLVYEQFHALNNDFTFGRYYINQEKYDELIAFDVKSKDIIISCSGIYLGKLAIVPEGAKAGIINQALLKLTLDENIYKNEFFVKVFTQENFKETYFASERGAAIPNFPPMSTFKDFKFICPPIKIQNEYLKLVQNLQNQIDIITTEQKTTDNLFQTLIQKAFKGELVA